MRKLITFATAMVLSATASAYAADLPVKAPVAPIAVPFSWSGFYVGGNAGGSWRSYDLDPQTTQSVDPIIGGTTTLAPGSFIVFQQVTNVNVPGRGIVVVPGTSRDMGSLSGNAQGFVGGGQIGYNMQWGRFVVGVEGDAQATSGKTSASFAFILPATALTAASPVTVTRTFETDWMASLRLRAGYTPLDRVLLYATGGLALAGGTVTSTDTYSIGAGPAAPGCPNGLGSPGCTTTADLGVLVGGYPSVTGTASGTQTLVGWTLGGGVDWAVTDNIVIGVLYRHSDFGAKTFNTGTNTGARSIAQTLPGPCTGTAGNCNIASGPGMATPNGLLRFTDDQATVRVSYRFGSR
jgi:outer membrane immunogenic protein